jgi:hypothetical protein
MDGAHAVPDGDSPVATRTRYRAVPHWEDQPLPESGPGHHRPGLLARPVLDEHALTAGEGIVNLLGLSGVMSMV